MGTPDFAVPALKALIENGHRILAVVTQPDRPKGRGRKIIAPPVKQLAAERDIPVLQPERISDRAFTQSVAEMEPDIIIVIAFGQILKKDLLTLPKWGVINVHASLLPKYRGPAPIQRAIMDNEKWTGLTVMRMDEGLDTGPILFQKAIPILDDMTAGDLHDKLALEAGDLLITSLQKMAEYPAKEIPQDDDKATYAPKIKKDATRIDWGDPAEKISATIRALDPWPGAVTTLQDKEIKLFSPVVIDSGRKDTTPGKVIKAEHTLWVETGSGVIEIREVLYPGRKRLPASEFLRGFSLSEGTVLGGSP